jgi:choice-of-anchor B domain-containing protein
MRARPWARAPSDAPESLVRRRSSIVLAAAAAITGLAFMPLTASMSNNANDHSDKQLLGGFSSLVPEDVTGPAACVDGFVIELWACDGVDLISFYPTSQTSLQTGGDLQANLGNGGKIEISDSWGWTSPTTGDRYVIAGKTNGAAFFRVTDNPDPVSATDTASGLEYLGDLPNPSPSRSVWHDIKVDGNYAYVVAESVASGMQVFDLTRLDGATGEQSWTPDTSSLFTGIESHNIVMNADADVAYLVGGTTGLDPAAAACRSGLVIVDISNPALPMTTGCWSDRGYVHDAQCMTYSGPDADHDGKDLCFTANPDDDTMSIVDVSDPTNPVELSNATYPNGGYAHQGWLSEDGAFFFFGDEGDEGSGKRTRTMIFDVSDLDNAQDGFEWRNPVTESIDHNLYTNAGLLYMANYSSGLRVVDTAGLYDNDGAAITQDDMTEIAFFDVYPENDSSGFFGSWSVYPFFEDGVVAISAYDGLYLVQLHADVLESRFTPGS